MENLYDADGAYDQDDPYNGAAVPVLDDDRGHGPPYGWHEYKTRQALRRRLEVEAAILLSLD